MDNTNIFRTLNRNFVFIKEKRLYYTYLYVINKDIVFVPLCKVEKGR